MESIFGEVGAVGFSINSREEVETLFHTFLRLGLQPGQVKFHYVMGSTPLEELSNIVLFLEKETKTKVGGRNTGFGAKNLLLLDYKNKGKGDKYTPHPYEGCIEMIKGHEIHRINADTAFLQRFREEIEKECPRTFLEYEEGKFSCYIDPIRGVLAPSSFVGSEEEIPFDPLDPKAPEKLKEIFASF